MIPQPTDFFFALHAQDHSRREAVATAERLPDSGGFRMRPRCCCAGSPTTFRLCPPLRGQRACRP